MARRPWIIPEEVRDYSGKQEADRSDTQLRVDIARAEQYIIAYTNNKFDGDEPIPEAVKLAALILASNYARTAIIHAKNVKSETFDDYSYTNADDVIEVSDLGLGALLDEFVLAVPRNGIDMRMRRL